MMAIVIWERGVRATVLGRSVARLAISLLVILSSIRAAGAEDVADFYRGKTVSIVVGHEAGTGFDLYARVLAKHIGRHIPGAPAINVQNMQGATGLTAASWLYNAAPRDGSVIATFAYTVPFEPLLGAGQGRFDPRRFNWIGNLEDGAPVCGVSRAAGIDAFDDLLTREVVFGGSGAGASGPLTQSPNAVRALTGARIKLAQGYRGSHDLKLALERGEIFGVCGLSFATIRSEWRDLLATSEFRPILQLAPRERPELAGVPRIYDRARSDEDRQVFDLVFGTQTLGRLYVAPPETPPSRIAALRAALMDTASDSAFLAEARTAGLDLDAVGGENVRKLIDGFYSSIPSAVTRARRAVRGEN